MAKTDKERLATGFWNRIESNQATDCNTYPYIDYACQSSAIILQTLLSSISSTSLIDGLHQALLDDSVHTGAQHN